MGMVGADEWGGDVLGNSKIKNIYLHREFVIYVFGKVFVGTNFADQRQSFADYKPWSLVVFPP
jgi:hypothetical protein